MALTIYQNDINNFSANISRKYTKSTLTW